MRTILVSLALAGVAASVAAQTPAAAVELVGVPAVSLADERIVPRVRGLRPGQPVIVRAAARETDDRVWHSWAGFHADARGEVNLATAVPRHGTYERADSMGLVHSLDLPGTARGRTRFEHRRWDPWKVVFTVEVAGATVATVEHQRVFARGVNARDVRSDGLVGTLFEPADSARAPAVLVLSGSEGGLAGEDVAALLASRGFVALALAYFGAETLPANLEDIPLEYFTRAIDWLERQPSVAPGRLAILGTSKGAEAALLTAAMSPAVRAVVGYVPSSVAWSCLCNRDTSSWTVAGRAVPFVPAGNDPSYRPPPGFPLRPAVHYRHRLETAANAAAATIQVERIAGEVLLIAGGDDQLWPSSEMSLSLKRRMAKSGRRASVLTYTGAGHLIGKYYSPASSTLVGGGRLETGGSPHANGRAQSDSWPRVLEFLRRTLKG